jgi:hypothetical protein
MKLPFREPSVVTERKEQAGGTSDSEEDIEDGFASAKRHFDVVVCIKRDWKAKADGRLEVEQKFPQNDVHAAAQELIKFKKFISNKFKIC